METRKTIRQEGLLDQKKLSKLNISICGNKEFSNLRSQIELMATQLGIKKPKSYNSLANKDDFIIFLDNSKIDNIDNISYCRVLLLDDGITLTQDWSKKSGQPSKIQEPGLSIIAAALVWQEILRQTRVILPIEIPKKYININLRIDPSTFTFDNLKEHISVLGLNDKEVDYKVLERTDSSGHLVINIRLDEGNKIADNVLDLFRISSKSVDERFHQPTEIKITIPRVDKKLSGSVIFAGVGGLGTWALDTFSKGIINSNSLGDKIKIDIIDPDTSIELHNLNRQVLYDEIDIGHPKAEKAAFKISKILPNAQINSYIGTLNLTHLESLNSNILSNSYEDEEDEIDDEEFITSNLNTEFKEIIERTDVILCGVDNLRARTVLNAISSRCNIPMINAGAQGFKGNFDIFNQQKSCMLCRYGLQAVHNSRPMSCQEDGEIPFGSIVTSTAIFGALEGLALISIMARDGSSEKWPSNIRWNGMMNQFNFIEDKEYGIFSNIFLPQGNHLEHLNIKLYDNQESIK
jgi:molybdopterin-synthase adenylyltransferase